jgi:2-polyprenyl-6-methoxyphenol hydroxylase-like FAD-dependent oxidoreductase
MEGHVEPKKILIVGGGTAGWMAANLMVAAWGKYGFEITLIEAPDIGIIGVGEGSTPQLKNFMEKIGLAEQEWMPRCNATYKLGIDFRRWSTKPGFDKYFHPFPAQTDDYTVPTFFYNSFVRRKGLDVEGHPDHFFLNGYLADNKFGPFAGENFPFTVQYGYHFDSALLGKYLAEVAEGRGVKYVQAKITDAKVTADGTIEAVMDDQGQIFAADYFVDCTGFRSFLMQQALEVPFVPFAENLFNDSAVVFPTERPEEVAPQTISTALKYGWAWTIPLTSRIGNGYVYSSAYVNADDAEKELREFTGMQDSDVEARHLKMKVGRVARHWEGNCIAIGLSQGFIEPLEATALHLVQDSVEAFIDNLETGNFTAEKRQQFNDHANARFEAVRDYIVAHYRVNSRTDTDYWRDNTNNDHLSRSLYDVISTWTSGKNLTDEINRQDIDQYFPSISWHCLLAGYGIYPTQEQLKAGDEAKDQAKLEQIHDFIRRCSMNYTPHMELLKSQQAA